MTKISNSGPKMSRGSKMKQEFVKLIRRQGYNSINGFCVAAGINTSNLYTNLKGEFPASIDRMFTIANTLGVPVIEVVEIMRPDDMKKNRKAVEKYKVPVE